MATMRELLMEEQEKKQEESTEGTFRLRLALAGILLLLVIIFDISGKSLAGITTQQVFRAISSDYGAVIDAWVENVKIQGI